MTPEKIGRYEVVEVIGQGGMSTVYKGYDPDLARHIAIKVMPAVLSEDDMFRARFMQEARAAARLDHQAIAPIYDFGTFEEQIYLAMRLLTGGTLQTRLRNSQLSFGEIVTLIERMAGALEFAHQNGVVHRDIKPGNILFDENDNAYLVDFGIAKLTQSSVNLTGTGMIGTPTYMSPEQIKGETIDGRSDIYSLGIVLFEMLAGQPPYAGDSPSTLVYQHIYEPIPDISAVRDNIPSELTQIINKALAKDPDERYQRPSELANALKQLNSSTLKLPSQPPIDTAVTDENTQFEGPSKTVYQNPPADTSPSGHVPTTVQEQATDLAKGINFGLILGAALLIIIVILIIIQIDQFSLILTTLGQWIGHNSLFILSLGGIAILLALLYSPISKWWYKRQTTSSVTGSFPPPDNTITEPRSPTTPEEKFKPKRPTLLVKRQLPKQESQSTPTLLMKPTYNDWLTSPDHLIEELMHEDYERLKSFVMYRKQGRFVLTGYGRFGGTSLVQGAMERARMELGQRGDKALLAFYFKVLPEDDSSERTFNIQANGFSFGTLHYNNAIEVLRPYTDPPEEIQPDDKNEISTDMWEFSLESPLHFNVESPIGSTLFSKASFTSIFSRKPAQRSISFEQLVNELNSFFEQEQDHSHLRDILLRVLESYDSPSQILIILDRIHELETLENLSEATLFQNPNLQVIAIARKEDFDRWPNKKQRLQSLGFDEWYIPCNWQFTDQIKETLLKSNYPPDDEVLDKFDILHQHWSFIGRGAPGEILHEIKDSRYWSIDQHGNSFIRLDKLPRAENVRHNAWRQAVLDLNWEFILANRFPTDQQEDRVKRAVYSLLGWITEKQSFTREEIVKKSNQLTIKISRSNDITEEVVNNLLHVLTKNRYLEHDTKYRVSWNKNNPPSPVKVKTEFQKTSTIDNGETESETAVAEKQKDPTPDPVPVKTQEVVEPEASTPPEAEKDFSKVETLYMNRPTLNLSSKMTDPTEFRISLKMVLNEYFNETELRELCYELGIDFQAIEGKNKPDKIQELIKYVERRNQMTPFVQVICQLRPNACS